MSWPRPKYTLVTSVTIMRQKYGDKWYNLPNVFYIGMPGPAQRGVGIPYEKIGGFGKPWECLKHPNGWRDGYKEYLEKKIREDSYFKDAVQNLAGKVLVCWCKGKKHHKNLENNISDPDCHGDLLAVTAETLAEQTRTLE